MVNICKTVHYALDRIRNPLVMWIGAWWMLDCVGLKMVYGKDKGEGKAPPRGHCYVLYRKLRSFCLSDNQGHCDTVLSKKTFLKSFLVL